MNRFMSLQMIRMEQTVYGELYKHPFGINWREMLLNPLVFHYEDNTQFQHIENI